MLVNEEKRVFVDHNQSADPIMRVYEESELEPVVHHGVVGFVLRVYDPYLPIAGRVTKEQVSEFYLCERKKTLRWVLSPVCTQD